MAWTWNNGECMTFMKWMNGLKCNGMNECMSETSQRMNVMNENGMEMKWVDDMKWHDLKCHECIACTKKSEMKREWNDVKGDEMKWMKRTK